jgi:hypothetical protein
VARRLRLDEVPGDSPQEKENYKGSLDMDIALMLSGFSGLAAAFVASALWATRPTALSNEQLVRSERTHRPR